MPLGLPLPPAAGKARIALSLPQTAIFSVRPAPLLTEAADCAPTRWQPTLTALSALADTHGIAVRTFGSLTWQHLTGLDYLGPDSDLDLLWTLPEPSRLDAFLKSLRTIDEVAPMRLDGELQRPDGAGVQWRELTSNTSELAIKTQHGVVLGTREDFLNGMQHA